MNQANIPSAPQKIKGFTIIELIVVITILSILGTIGFLAVGGYSSKARDSARVGDLALVAKSLELSVIAAWTYPIPDNSFAVTYSGGVVWNQWTVWPLVMQYFDGTVAGGGLGKKPVDPLRNVEYAYSSLAFGNAYQLKADYEGDLTQNAIAAPGASYTVADGRWTGGNPFLPSAHAEAGNPNTAYVRGNYGGLAAKTVTGGLTYVLAIPSILTNSGAVAWGFLRIEQNALSGTLLFNGKPLSNATSFNPNAQSNGGVVFTWTWLPTSNSTWKISEIVEALVEVYGGSDLTGNTSIANLLSITETQDIHNLGIAIVSVQLGGRITDRNTIGVSLGWRAIDANCDKPDIKVGSKYWAGCNSTIGSIVRNFNSGGCENYNGSNIGGTACYGITTRENWTGISESAHGYSTGIPGISTNIYGGLYSWNDMSSNSCLGTGISTDNTICPCKGGYHVPSNAEWDALEQGLGCTGSNKVLVNASSWECLVNLFADEPGALGWFSLRTNTLRNKLGLSLAGSCNGGSCSARGYYGLYWSATLSPNAPNSWYRQIDYNMPSVFRGNYNPARSISVRCIRD